MRINLSAILIIPTIGDRLFSLWSLIPGIPVGVSAFGRAIRYKPQENSGQPPRPDLEK